jgi:hypothetical protein
VCLESLMKGELFLPVLTARSVIKWLRTLFSIETKRKLFPPSIQGGGVGSEIDILLNPHNLLIKIIISSSERGGEGNSQ